MSGPPTLPEASRAAVRRARLWLCVAAGILFLGCAGAGLALGPGLLASGLLGGAAAAALCLTGAGVVGWAARTPGAPAAPAAVDYLLKLVLAGAAVVAARGIDGLDARVVGVCVLVGVLASSGITAAVFVRARSPLADASRDSQGYRGPRSS